MERKKKVLLAVLDWGLGHATRCIPIVNALLQKNYEVVLASNGRAYKLLQKEFPHLKIFPLPRYNPKYSRGSNMLWAMAKQLPKFFYTMLRERWIIDKIVSREGIDVIISDNRYTCYSKKVKSVFITHQTRILMPEGHSWLERQVNRLNQYFISQFSECWIPAPDTDLLGELHDGRTQKSRFVGYLSHMQKSVQEKKYDVCVVCSGPEPQRTMFEKLAMEQLENTDLRYTIVRGKPEALNPVYSHEPHRQIINYLTHTALAEVIQQSNVVIARSGYSMIMDLAKLQARAIFVPTPGQTEQEYLAKKLMTDMVCYTMCQQDFDLSAALKASIDYKGFDSSFSFDNELLDSALDSLLC